MARLLKRGMTSSATKVVRGPTHFDLSDGHSIPAIGLGVYQLNGSECVQVVKTALEVGWRCFDSAQFYRNEKEVGQAIRESGVDRSEIYVTTKVGAGLDTPDGCRKKVEKSLNDLNVGYIDLFLIHSPMLGEEGRVASWRNLSRLAADDDRIKSVGVSNFGVRHLEELAAAGLPNPAVNQIENAIVNYCRDRGILLQAYCPLMRGAESKPSFGQGADWAKKAGHGWKSPILIDIAQKHGKTIGQVLLRWSIQRGFAPQPKTSSRERLLENLAVFDFELDGGDMSSIDSMNSESTPGKQSLEWNPVDCP